MTLFILFAVALLIVFVISVMGRLASGEIPSKVMERAHQQPIQFPQTFDTALVTTSGERDFARLRVYNDAVYIYDREGNLLACITEPEIEAVIVGDFSKQGTSMVGFGIVTPKGQFRFLHIGPFAEHEVETIIRIITCTVEWTTGRRVPRLNSDAMLHSTSAV